MISLNRPGIESVESFLLTKQQSKNFLNEEDIYIFMYNGYPGT